MSEEKETTRKIASNPNNATLSEERTTSVKNDNNNGLLIGVLITLFFGLVGTGFYYLSNRPEPVPILVPGANNTIKEKSTVIERNNSTTKEVKPEPQQQPTPNIQINVPAPTATTNSETPIPEVSPTTDSTDR